MDESAGFSALGGFGLRDRDVMNLLDQLELFTLELGRGRMTQGDFWLFVYNTMRSGRLGARSVERHVRDKLKGLGIKPE